MGGSKGKECARSLTFFKVINNENSEFRMKTKFLNFNMCGNARTDIVNSSSPWVL